MVTCEQFDFCIFQCENVLSVCYVFHCRMWEVIAKHLPFEQFRLLGDCSHDSQLSYILESFIVTDY